MIREQPIVYIESNFLSKFYAELARPYRDIAQKAYLNFINNLISRSTIYLDMTQEEYLNYLRPLESSSSELDSTDVLRMALKKISGDNKPGLGKPIRSIIENNQKVQIKNAPNYVLADISSAEAIRQNKVTGLAILSSEFNSIGSQLHELSIKKLESPFNPSDHFNTLPFAQWILIEDPYLHTQNDDFIKKFLKSLIKSENRQFPIQLAVVVQKPKYSDGSNSHSELMKFNNKVSVLKKMLALLKGELPLGSIIELIEFKPSGNVSIHDRYILSASYWITCGYGFREKYSASTYLLKAPVGIYHDILKDRLNFYKKFYPKVEPFRTWLQ